MFEIVLIAAVIAGFILHRNQGVRIDKLSADLAKLKEQIATLGPSAAVQQPVAETVAVANSVLPQVQTDTADNMQTPALASQAEENASLSVAADEPGSEEAAVAAIVASVAEETAAEEAATHDTSPPDQAPAKVAKPKESLESRLGARWTVWVGGLALAFGGLFMVKYSIENDLISPALRLSFAALFGLALLAGGEAVRRRIGAFASASFQNAMIPGVLTAAGSLTLLGSIFAAHMVYGYLGAGTAFLLLALVSLITVGLSLLHGQALAGFGLLASMVTPALVQSTSPNPWGLFLFLLIAWVATAFASRLRDWKIVPILANAGMSLWSVLYLADLSDGVWPVTVALLGMIAGTALLWPGSRGDDPVSLERVRNLFPVPKPPAASGENGEPLAAATPAFAIVRIAPWMALLFAPHAALYISSALGSLLAGLMMVAPGPAEASNPVVPFFLLAASLSALSMFRLQAVWAGFASAALAVFGFLLLCNPLMVPVAADAVLSSGYVQPAGAFWTSIGLAGLFAVLGIATVLMKGHIERQIGELWSAVAVGVPLVVLVIAYLVTGNLTRDWSFGLATVILGLAYLATAESLHRKAGAAEERDLGLLISVFVTGSALAFLFAIHAVANGIVTTLAVAVLGFAYVMATRVRNWAILPWIMALADVVVMARIGWNPAVVNADSLSTTPFFNALLPGYGLPSLLTGLAAYELRKWPSAQIRIFLQALASLGALLTIAILVRHAMNGGVLDSAVPTLAEQSIYTLLTIGASAVLVTLDLRAPSPAFRWGSMAVGVVSMLSVLFAHLISLNPVLTGEYTGSIAVTDLLLIGYLLPGLAALGLGYYAEGKRPAWYRQLIEASGFLLLFLWVTLEIRRLFWGTDLSVDLGFKTAEIYVLVLGWIVLSFVVAYICQRLARAAAALPWSQQPAAAAGPFSTYAYAALVFGGIGIFGSVVLNLLVWNPYHSGDSTGQNVVLNLLLAGYLAPALVLLLRALYGRKTAEPRPFVLALSITGLVMMLAYVTLEVRRFWQGEFIPGWNGFLQGETYSYSVAWLIFGVGLLALGSRFNAISLRLASAAIVLLAVVKVFLIDMSNLEGILRALSFIGLGLVLIAIGMFYQRILGRLSAQKPDAPVQDAAPQEQADSGEPPQAS